MSVREAHAERVVETVSSTERAASPPAISAKRFEACPPLTAPRSTTPARALASHAAPRSRRARARAQLKRRGAALSASGGGRGRGRARERAGREREAHREHQARARAASRRSVRAERSEARGEARRTSAATTHSSGE